MQMALHALHFAFGHWQASRVIDKDNDNGNAAIGIAMAV
jgi:hypothetical protein